MAQEQAKTPPAGTAAGGAGDDPFDIKGTSAGDIREDAPFATLDQPSGAEGERKPSLAERLRAEQQRKTPEPKMDEPKTADLGDAAAASAAKAAGRRRPAGPPPRRMAATAANDDLPSIGGLIFALQQKPSKSPVSRRPGCVAGLVRRRRLLRLWTDLDAGCGAWRPVRSPRQPVGAHRRPHHSRSHRDFLVPCAARLARPGIAADGLGHDRGRGAPSRARQARRAVGRLTGPDHPPPGRRHERCHLARHRARRRARSPRA